MSQDSIKSHDSLNNLIKIEVKKFQMGKKKKWKK